MGKHERRQRKKRLKKQIEGLKRQAEIHHEKIETWEFRKDFNKDTTPEYWKGEIENYEKQIRKKKEKLEKKKNHQ